MPLCKRIIPKLDIKGDNLVKGINLEGLRVLGKPEIFAKNYYDNGADELFYQDVVASLYGRNTLDDQIKKTAKEIFIPLTVGGGIRNIDDLPDNAKRYVHALEDLVGAKISSISTSPERDDTILVEDPFNN